jgi:hypothetical protein
VLICAGCLLRSAHDDRAVSCWARPLLTRQPDTPRSVSISTSRTVTLAGRDCFRSFPAAVWPAAAAVGSAPSRLPGPPAARGWPREGFARPCVRGRGVRQALHCNNTLATAATSRRTCPLHRTAPSSSPSGPSSSCAPRCCRSRSRSCSTIRRRSARASSTCRRASPCSS